MSKVAIINYGMGNLGSVRRAFEALDADVLIADQPNQLEEASHLILPGVGSFTDGMNCLSSGGWVDVLTRHVQELGKPLLGICLGMQLLATAGEEGGNTPGLGLISGRVTHLQQLGCQLRVPHVGWNSIAPSSQSSPMMEAIPEGTDFYFVHSYSFVLDEHSNCLATANYGIPIVAAIQNNRIIGTQFHPEKSSKAGLRLLQNFLTL
jgi:glutamine amidotransferase